MRTVRRPAGLTSRGPNGGRSLSIPQDGGRLEVAKQRIRAQQLTKQVPFSSAHTFTFLSSISRSTLYSGGGLATDERSSGSNSPWSGRAPRPGLSVLQVKPIRGCRWPPPIPAPPIQQEPVHGQAETRGRELFQFGVNSENLTTAPPAGAAAGDREVRRGALWEESEGGAEVEGGRLPQDGEGGGGARAGVGREQQRG